MKTAISLPDSLFKSAELTAKKLGINRSSLFSRAIKEYLENYNPVDVTEKLNRVYENIPSTLDTDIVQMQNTTITKEDW